MNIHRAVFLTVFALWGLLPSTVRWCWMSSLLPMPAAWAETAASGKTWKTVEELSAEEKGRVDFADSTPRHADIPYLPAEPYPFQAPFTAEEMAYRMMEFTQRPRWSCAFANLFGSITTEGFLLGKGMNISYSAYPAPGGLEVHLQSKPGDEVYRYLTQGVFPPGAQGSQNLLIRYRTDPTFTKKEDLFSYTLSTRRVRHQNQMRRNDKFPYMAQSFDDASGRDAWEFSWRLLGADVLHQSVRFPVTRPKITVADGDIFHEIATANLKLMGDSYPHYTADGGVPCFVVEARAREEWLPGYKVPRIIYWLDQYSFFPLRIEMYDREEQLNTVEVRVTKMMNPALGERGYGPFLILDWDIPLDLLTYIVRDGHRLKDWAHADRETFFNPDFMRRRWFLTPVKSLLAINTPEEFFLRPSLELGKFPDARKIQLDPRLQARIEAQDAAGQLVFDVPVDPAAPPASPAPMQHAHRQ